MMQKSPFKFLDSFTKDDREIFFGRDREIEELHTRIFESKILLVYGTSGTGKSSLINCGLANRFSDSDWLPVNVRRGININRSLFEALAKTAITKDLFEKISASAATGYNLEKLLHSVWLDHFKPVFIIFDQFEELFIFGSKEEKNELIRNVAKVINSEIQCRFIFSIREEYLAGVTEFEREIPSFLSNRIRIEKMTRQNAIQTIEGPCRINNIAVEPGFSETLLAKLNPDTPDVELTWLQIYLDRIMRLAGGEDYSVKRLSKDLLEKAGEVKDILGTFLDEQISKLDDPENGMAVLKSFVSVKGTKCQITEEEVIEYSGTFGKEIESVTIKALIQRFIRLRILRDKDENGKYELRHDSLASKIFEDITLVEKELLEVKSFIENSYSNFEKRGLFLSEEDLKYIAPYEDKLFLNEKSQNFIEESKWSIHKVRRRRINFAIVAASVIILILSFFSIWAFRERGKAVEQQKIADNQKNVAINANKAADEQRKIAQEGEIRARESEKKAIEQQNIADKQKQVAVRANILAEEAKKQALEEKSRAETNEKDAIAAKQFAEEQRNHAQEAEKEAKRLSLLSTAQNLALKSMTMAGDPQLMGLLAVQALNFSKNNGGAIDDPVIWQALEKAYTTIDVSRHSIYTGSANEIWSISENENGLLSTDMDGNVISWNQIGNDSIIDNPMISSYINFISLSPIGDKLITGYEDNRLILKSLIQNNNESELRGHISPIITAAWSEDGNFLATGGKDSLIILWNTKIQPATGLKTFRATSSVRFLTFCSPDTIISIHDDGTINLWEVKNDTSELLFVRKQIQPLCAAWNRPKKTLLTGCSKGVVISTYLASKPYYSLLENYHNSGISYIAFNRDFSLLAIASWDKVIKLYNYHKFFELANTVGGVITIDNVDARVRSLIFTSDNKLVSGMSDKSIRIWETSSQKLALLICGLVKRDMTDSEWTDFVGTEIPYEKTCGNNP
jgi:WD40 repeat protein